MARSVKVSTPPVNHESVLPWPMRLFNVIVSFDVSLTLDLFGPFSTHHALRILSRVFESNVVAACIDRNRKEPIEVSWLCHVHVCIAVAFHDRASN